jgi:hypothetical protein
MSSAFPGRPRFVIAPGELELETPEGVQSVLRTLDADLSSYKKGPVQARTKLTNHGVGADWPTITIEILELGAIAFFVIPEFRKRIKDAVQGWREMGEALQRFRNWLFRRRNVVSCSVEVAFLESLNRMADSTDVDELILMNVMEVFGKSGGPAASFETSELVYYVFVFQQADQEASFVMIIDSKLDVVGFHRLVLNPLTKFMESQGGA